jgi:hypothetical protein
MQPVLLGKPLTSLNLCSLMAKMNPVLPTSHTLSRILSSGMQPGVLSTQSLRTLLLLGICSGPGAPAHGVGVHLPSPSLKGCQKQFLGGRELWLFWAVGGCQDYGPQERAVSH